MRGALTDSPGVARRGAAGHRVRPGGGARPAGRNDVGSSPAAPATSSPNIGAQPAGRRRRRAGNHAQTGSADAARYPRRRTRQRRASGHAGVAGRVGRSRRCRSCGWCIPADRSGARPTAYCWHLGADSSRVCEEYNIWSGVRAYPEAVPGKRIPVRIESGAPPDNVFAQVFTRARGPHGRVPADWDRTIPRSSSTWIPGTTTSA